MHFLPHVNMSAARISVLIGAVAAVCGVFATPRSMRSTMVLLTVLGTLLQGQAFDPTFLNANGHWVLGPNSASMNHYFTLQGCMASFAPMVRSFCASCTVVAETIEACYCRTGFPATASCWLGAREVRRVQVQVGTTGSPQDQRRARAVALLGLQDAGQVRAATRRALVEADLAVFLSYQASADGRRAQASLIAASGDLAARVAGGRDGGELVSNVFQRLRDQVLRDPGLWLLRFPLNATRLGRVAGAPLHRRSTPMLWNGAGSGRGC